MSTVPRWELIESGFGWDLPTTHHPSDHLEAVDNPRSGDIEHRRHGLLIGLRPWSSAGVWNITWENQARAVVNFFNAFRAARVFYFQPQGDEGAVEYTVVMTKYKVTRSRGGSYWDITCTIEQVVT